MIMSNLIYFIDHIIKLIFSLVLLRFTSLSPQQFKTLPLRLIQSPNLQRHAALCNKKEAKKPLKIDSKSGPEFQKENIPECIFVEKKMSLAELGLIWKTATLTR